MSPMHLHPVLKIKKHLPNLFKVQNSSQNLRKFNLTKITETSKFGHRFISDLITNNCAFNDCALNSLIK